MLFRYINSMEDVIKKIYREMEFDLFDDDDHDGVDYSDSLPSSSNQDDGRCRSQRGSGSASASALHLLQRDGRSSRQREDDDRHDKLTARARERRDRQRRLSSFTSWVPDLRRVWALKHPGKEPCAWVPRSRSRSCAKRRRAACTDVVLETPVTSGKRHMSGSESDDARQVAARRSAALGAVSKTLFDDEVVETDVSSSST
jgi:hypothetical protein